MEIHRDGTVSGRYEALGSPGGVDGITLRAVGRIWTEAGPAGERIRRCEIKIA